MVALAGALGGFHFAQQSVHFGNRQRTIRPDGGVAGHGGQHLILALGEHAAAAEFGYFAEDVARELCGIGLRQRHRHATHGQRVRRNHGQLEAEPGKRVGIFRGGCDFQGAGGHGRGDQQLLRRDAIVVERVLELLINDAFVSRMHVDHHESVPVLRQHVYAGQLCQREAKRMVFILRHHRDGRSVGRVDGRGSGGAK